MSHTVLLEQVADAHRLGVGVQVVIALFPVALVLTGHDTRAVVKRVRTSLRWSAVPR
jgi:hypothetical protein